MIMDEEQQSTTSASTTVYGGSSKQENNNAVNAIKTAVTFGSTAKDTSTISKDADSGRQVKMGSPDRKLSMVSRMYDIDGDGQLGKCQVCLL